MRALLNGLQAGSWDYHFFSTLAFSRQGWTALLPAGLRAEFKRRAYDVPSQRLTTRPMREALRLGAERFTRHGQRASDSLSIDAVYRDLDRFVASHLKETSAPPQAVYAYEDGAAETFGAASALGVKRIYDLPIAYWATGRKILDVEAARHPGWEPTLGATSDGESKRNRKTLEIHLADLVICPSEFVHDSLPEEIRREKRCVVAPFGSPHPLPARPPSSEKLRVLFAGQMSQRKGLADVFAAMRLLRRCDVELVVLGTPLLPMAFYRRAYPEFSYQAPRPHSAVLELMSSCDLLVLPSLLEGRALVQQEALSCGLPLIVTENAGAADLIVEGETGFLVPIRSPEAIAARIDWFAANRDQLEAMRPLCQAMAARHTWEDYARKILGAIAQATIPSLVR